MIFLSHSSKDNKRLVILVKKLEAKGVAIWFDQEQIRAGDSVTREMDKALAGCNRLLVAWSQFAEQSLHVWNELDAFYIKKPQPGNILFVRLDETPVPTLFAARKYIDLGDDSALDVAALVSWASGREDERIQEMDAALPAPATLHMFPRGPVVKGHWVTHALISAYAAIPRVQATVLLHEANRLRLEADPNDPRVTVVRFAALPDIGIVGTYAFWQEAFLQACLNGPRMLAALLLAQPDDLFEPAARKDRAKLLQHLRTQTSSPK